jgi:hypothetical protein
MFIARALAGLALVVVTGGCGDAGGSDGPAEDLTMPPPGSDLTGTPAADLTGTPAPDLATGPATLTATLRMVKTQQDPKTINCVDSGITAVNVTLTDDKDATKTLTTKLDCKPDEFFVQGTVTLPASAGPFTAKAVTVGAIVASAEGKNYVPGGSGLAFPINLCDPLPNPVPKVCM